MFSRPNCATALATHFSESYGRLLFEASRSFPRNGPSVVARVRFRSADLHRESRISPLKARLDVERKRYAVDAQTASAFLVFPTNAGEFPQAGEFPVFRVFHQPPAHRVEMNGNGRRERAGAGVTRRLSTRPSVRLQAPKSRTLETGTALRHRSTLVGVPRYLLSPQRPGSRPGYHPRGDCRAVPENPPDRIQAASLAPRPTRFSSTRKATWADPDRVELRAALVSGRFFFENLKHFGEGVCANCSESSLRWGGF